MILTLRRTGGFAGLQETLARVDSAELGGAAQRALAARLEALAKVAAEQVSPGADQLRWEVEVREAGRPPHTLVVLDDGNPKGPGPQALTALLDGLGIPTP